MSHHEQVLRGKRVVVLAEDTYEDLELWYPALRLREAGAKVAIAGPRPLPAEYASKHGYPAKSDLSVADVRTADFDGVVIPGGYAPDRLRRDQGVLKLVRQFSEAGKLVAFICHAGWVLVSAGVLAGRRVTGFVAIKDDLVNAGAKYEDASVVIDRNFVSSRFPDDLPDFCRGIIGVLAGAGQAAEAPAMAAGKAGRPGR